MLLLHRADESDAICHLNTGMSRALVKFIFGTVLPCYLWRFSTSRPEAAAVRTVYLPLLT